MTLIGDFILTKFFVEYLFMCRRTTRCSAVLLSVAQRCRQFVVYTKGFCVIFTWTAISLELAYDFIPFRFLSNAFYCITLSHSNILNYNVATCLLAVLTNKHFTEMYVLRYGNSGQYAIKIVLICLIVFKNTVPTLCMLGYRLNV